ncbi:hypothetical protein Hanom_Chr14g01266491 [Helianthus anomalus]
MLSVAPRCFRHRLGCDTIGVPSDLYSREAGLYMWQTILFDKMGWDKVTRPHKDAIMNHLKKIFNFDEVECNLEAQNLIGDIIQVLKKQYYGRKHGANTEFLDNEGYNDIESARVNNPVDMPNDNWQRTINHFLDPKYIARCEANTQVHQRELFPNRMRTTSFSSTAYKHVVSHPQNPPAEYH